MKEVGYPTSFSASDTTLLQFEGPGLENRLSGLGPRLDEALRGSRDHVVRNIFPSKRCFLFLFLQVSFTPTYCCKKKKKKKNPKTVWQHCDTTLDNAACLSFSKKMHLLP